MSSTSDKEFIIKIGKQIRNLRLKFELTQLDLAIKCEMEENALQRIEKGRTNPTIKTLRKISRGLKVNFTTLFDFSEIDDVM